MNKKDILDCAFLIVHFYKYLFIYIVFHLDAFLHCQKNCENQPWLIDPGPGQYLYVKMDGIIVSNSTKCETKNRIIVHTGGAIHVSVCPKPPANSRHHVVEVFSDGWAVSSNAMILAPGQDPIRTIAVEFIVKEPASYTVTWLELTRRFVTTFLWIIMLKNGKV